MERPVHDVLAEELGGEEDPEDVVEEEQPQHHARDHQVGQTQEGHRRDPQTKRQHWSSCCVVSCVVCAVWAVSAMS